MRVLALGISRSGTESLKFALEELGYRGVYHGFELTGPHSASWCRMLDERDRWRIGREELDTVLGDYEAATDVPGFVLSEEFLNASPDAKVWTTY